MPIKVECDCGKKLSVKDELAGKRVKCPACQELLTIPKSAAEEDPAEDDWDDGEADEPSSKRNRKSRGGNAAASSKAGKKTKGKSSSSPNRGLLIGLSATGVVVLVVAAWMMWPKKPANDLAATPAANSTAIADASGQKPAPDTNPAGAHQATPPNVGSTPTTNPTATSITPTLDGDLKLLQGMWQVTDVEVAPEHPRAESIIAQMKLVSWNVKDDVLTMTMPNGASASTVKLDASQSPKTIDLIPLEGNGGRKTGLGIYSLEGDAWKLCISMGNAGADRPKEMKPGSGSGLVVLTLKKGTSPPPGNAVAGTAGAQFDMQAWRSASETLKSAKVNAILVSRQDMGESGMPAGLTHCALIDPLETADGTIAPELWSLMTSVSHLMVRTKSITDATLKQVSQHPGLLGINISGKSTVTPAGIAELKKCPLLTNLNFGGVSVTPELLNSVTQLSELQTFSIADVPVSSEMVGMIAKLGNLESLNLYNAGITDDDAAQIAMLTKLKVLLLEKSKITDKGLASLKSLSALTMFSVRGLAVTPPAVADFEAALPKCRVLK